jgi:hypothetical protein
MEDDKGRRSPLVKSFDVCLVARDPFGEPRLAEPVILVGLEVKAAHVIEHQARRPEHGVRRARGREPSPRGFLGVQRAIAA